YKEAVNDFSNILEQKPEDKEARVARAAAYLELKEADKAERDIQVIRRDDPAVKLPVLRNLQTIRKE
ncbi:tetratricopeptide repeat protein, partial [Arthrospira platensis SPKY1]|nr:tetratricopeptide repeat protein [Arthrospira platensis SPKY1]